MVAVNSLLYFLLSAGLSSNPDQAQDIAGSDPLIANGLDLSKLCPPNEQLSECEAHCQKNCTNFAKPFPCPRICVKGCICKEGLVRDVSGKCVDTKKCPGRDTCPRGEHYEQCSAHCQHNCTTWFKPGPCLRICAHGCVCDKGTIRGPKGKCIKPEKCPKKGSVFEEESSQEELSESFCPPNEEYSQCSAHCQRDCSNWADEDFKCTKNCVPGCVCKEGSVRGPGGRCIFPRQCPPRVHDLEEEEEIPEEEASKPSCPKNEVFSDCEAHCQKNCTNYKKPFACPKICVKGCVCGKGLVRGQDGKCVVPKQCPGKDICPKGEHYDQCKANCQTNCTTYGRGFDCDRNTCVYGCVCNLGTIRGPKGKCIKPTQCPKKSEMGSSTESSAESIEQDVPIAEDADEIVCPKYEHLDVCGAHCQKNCTNFDKPPMPCPYVCIKGCVCDEGYVRAQNGKCVKPEQCPVRDVCLHGEHFDMCQAHCQKSCTNWDKPIACPFICVKGCVCDEGTVRGPHGLCIKVDKCPKRAFAESQEQGVGSDEGFPEECTLEKKVGPCRARIPRYFFNQETKHCEKFYYGGCEQNENNFVTKEACERRCRKIAEPESSLTFEEQSEMLELPSECTLEKVIGPCKASIPRYFFNRETNQCVRFTYGGCQGNENNFESKELCERRCHSRFPEECTLEKKVGPCRARIPRYFFNQETKHCEKFYYGGCEQNQNNFVTKEACERRCTKIAEPEISLTLEEQSEMLELPTECTLEKEEGPCEAYFPRYFFNKETNQCEQFIYGGCQGNKNNFESKRLCERKCLSGSRSSAEMTSQEQSEVQAEELPTECTLEKDEGPCYGLFPRYFFNKETNQCEHFIYGGCQGNKNNFWFKSACEKKCLSDSRSSAEMTSQERSEVEAEELPEQCTLEKDEGPCRGNFPRFFFNKETNKCEQFIYGGCQGNENRFLSKRMCERKCLSELPTECTLEKDKGPCYGFFPRYFFNKETNQCEHFMYGGCQGNKNNFWFKSACEKKCLSGSRTSDDSNPEEESEVRAEELPEQCTLEKEEGPCRGNFPRFFFNQETNQCEQFIYGGCQGNENRFLSKRMCERKCLRGPRTSVDSNLEEEGEVRAEDSRTASQPNYEEESELQTEELPTECSLEKKEGICKGHLVRFYFNKETSKCEQFFYGGCLGNDNNFLSKRMCERKCLRGSSRSSDVSSREESEVKAEAVPQECTLPKKIGPCQAYFPRYYYNKETNQCEQFFYGGCQGNENNFETQEQCEQKCSTSELQ